MDSSWLIYDIFFSPLSGIFFPRITDVLSDSRVSWVTFGLAAFLWVEVVTQGILLLLCRDLLQLRLSAIHYRVTLPLDGGSDSSQHR
jgi:hypothetical protein